MTTFLPIVVRPGKSIRILSALIAIGALIVIVEAVLVPDASLVRRVVQLVAGLVTLWVGAIRNQFAWYLFESEGVWVHQLLGKIANVKSKEFLPYENIVSVFDWLPRWLPIKAFAIRFRDQGRVVYILIGSGNLNMEPAIELLVHKAPADTVDPEVIDYLKAGSS